MLRDDGVMETGRHREQWRESWVAPVLIAGTILALAGLGLLVAASF